MEKEIETSILLAINRGDMGKCGNYCLASRVADYYKNDGESEGKGNGT